MCKNFFCLLIGKQLLANQCRGMIGHGVFFFNDTFDFGRPYLDRLLTKSNVLKGNRCVH
jgi:hypothetical protein